MKTIPKISDFSDQAEDPKNRFCESEKFSKFPSKIPRNRSIASSSKITGYVQAEVIVVEKFTIIRARFHNPAIHKPA